MEYYISNAKILVIDDDPDIDNLFKMYLESNGLFQVDAYTDPIEGLYYFKKICMIWFYLI